MSASLAILAVTAIIQGGIYTATGSIALLADLIHNAGDALTAVPLAIAFLLRSERAERGAGIAVVLTILASAITAGVFAIERIIHPLTPEHLLALALAGVIGVIGNGIAARVRLSGGRRLNSAALIADGDHARSSSGLPKPPPPPISVNVRSPTCSCVGGILAVAKRSACPSLRTMPIRFGSASIHAGPEDARCLWIGKKSDALKPHDKGRSLYGCQRGLYLLHHGITDVAHNHTRVAEG